MRAVSSAIRRGTKFYQEDYFFARRIGKVRENVWLLGVMDGHGGSAVAEFCAKNIRQLFQLSNPHESEQALRSMVSDLHEKIQHMEMDHEDVGSTLAAVYVLPLEEKASVAIVGDSSVFILDREGKMHVSPVHDVKINSKERRAAESRGGVYHKGYIWESRNYITGLQMGRALGDGFFGSIISHEPEIYTVAHPVWVLVASDGLVNFRSKNIKRRIEEIQAFAQKRAGAEELMEWAEQRRLSDNATAVVWRSNRER